MALNIKFQYPVFSACGFECFLQVEADVDLYQPAEIDEYGRPTECDTPTSVEITSLMFAGAGVSRGIDIEALPREMIREILEAAYEKAEDDSAIKYELKYEFEPS